MIIRCDVCGADPAGRWKPPPAMIFCDLYQEDGSARDEPVRACRDHLSPKREEEIQAREKDRGWKKGEPALNAAFDRGEIIGLRDLLDRFTYDCLWRAEARGKRGVSACGVYLPDLEQPRPPDMQPGLARLWVVVSND